MREAALNPRVRKTLLSIEHAMPRQPNTLSNALTPPYDEEAGKALIRIHILRSTQGQAWVRGVKKLTAVNAAAAGTHPNVTRSLVSAMSETTVWNLEGVSEADLLPLVDHPNDNIRAQGRQLMVSLIGRPKPKPARAAVTKNKARGIV